MSTNDAQWEAMNAAERLAEIKRLASALNAKYPPEPAAVPLVGESSERADEDAEWLEELANQLEPNIADISFSKSGIARLFRIAARLRAVAPGRDDYAEAMNCGCVLTIIEVDNRCGKNHDWFGELRALAPAAERVEVIARLNRLWGYLQHAPLPESVYRPAIEPAIALLTRSVAPAASERIEERFLRPALSPIVNDAFKRARAGHYAPGATQDLPDAEPFVSAIIATYNRFFEARAASETVGRDAKPYIGGIDAIDNWEGMVLPAAEPSRVLDSRGPNIVGNEAPFPGDCPTCADGGPCFVAGHPRASQAVAVAPEPSNYDEVTCKWSVTSNGSFRCLLDAGHNGLHHVVFGDAEHFAVAETAERERALSIAEAALQRHASATRFVYASTVSLELDARCEHAASVLAGIRALTAPAPAQPAPSGMRSWTEEERQILTETYDELFTPVGAAQPAPSEPGADVEWPEAWAAWAQTDEGQQAISARTSGGVLSGLYRAFKVGIAARLRSGAPAAEPSDEPPTPEERRELDEFGKKFRRMYDTLSDSDKLTLATDQLHYAWAELSRLRASQPVAVAPAGRQDALSHEYMLLHSFIRETQQGEEAAKLHDALDRIETNRLRAAQSAHRFGGDAPIAPDSIAKHRAAQPAPANEYGVSLESIKRAEAELDAGLGRPADEFFEELRASQPVGEAAGIVDGMCSIIRSGYLRNFEEETLRCAIAWIEAQVGPTQGAPSKCRLSPFNNDCSCSDCKYPVPAQEDTP